MIYDKESKSLKIQDGEFVGKTVRAHRGLRSASESVPVTPDEEAVMYLEMEECSSEGII